MGEYLVYVLARFFGFVIRHLPVSAAAAIGRRIGWLLYYFDIRRRTLVCSNLKVAFARSKTPNELKRITKDIFENFGQNLIEVFLLPTINS